MEVYILDDLFRRVEVIDRFESLIWTERWKELGDFELVIQSSYENRTRFVGGVHLAVNESDRVMTIETVEDNTDAEGKSVLTIKGKSFEKILDDRVAKYSLSNLTTEPKWVLIGTPGQVARGMFDHICRAGALSPFDVIPFLQTGTIYPADTIPESGTVIRWEQEPASLLSAITDVCDLYDMGYRLVRQFDMSKLYFDIYTGSDRTTGQTQLAPVVFSQSLDNLQNTTVFRNTGETKNCAYVFSDQGFVVVYASGTDPEVEGFERRSIMVKADNLDGSPTEPMIQTYLVQIGNEELSKHRTWSAFDGELSQHTEYKYRVHYNLGDLVEMRNVDGLVNHMRVTEQIFVDDNQGERSYPTLSLSEFIEPGTWLSWEQSQQWIHLDGDPIAWGDLII